MSRENFHRLLQRYLDGQCTPDEEQLVHHWYQILDKNDQNEITPANVDAIEDAIWDKINQQINIGQADTSVRQLESNPRSKRVRFWLVAASAAVFLVASSTFIYLRIVCYPVKPSFVSQGTMPEHDIITVRNDTEKPMKVILADESFVELSPGALFEYPKRFKTTDREVRLVGDAFFAVAANEENPFWVFHEGMITKVLGTKFKIRAPNGKANGEVIVYAGKVDVYYNVDRQSFVKRILSTPEKASITTNQRAVLLPKTLKETVVENPLPISREVDAIRNETFRDIPVPALAETLSGLYGLDVVAGDNLEGITFTGDISGVGLFKQLNIICTVTNTHYEVVGTTIFLKRNH
ncbi:FecR family protein [Parapedobacter tibetensis]|uniref:FecR family protein n=1 Tax=Parapedobacter tibetensis TaxID=2972951 RepID=UPI00214DE233|nr:FecR family protein [Parapedobacter tibetensis]